MIYMKKYAFISLLLPLFFFHISSVFATEDLFITPRKQDLSRTCWAACCQMVLEYYYKTIDQEAIVTWAFNGANQGNSLSGSPKSCDKVLQSLPLSSPANLVTHYCFYPITKENVQTSMSFNQPIIAFLEGKGGKLNHDVLISACPENDITQYGRGI